MSEVVDAMSLPPDIADISDDQLARAWSACLESGRILPILKEELKCRIQSRRLSEGKEELQVEFSKPKKLQPRPDEIAKLQRRREQNRRAAQKFREKNRDRADILLERTRKMELQQFQLEAERHQLAKEKEALIDQLKQHMLACHPSDQHHSDHHRHTAGRRRHTDHHSSHPAEHCHTDQPQPDHQQQHSDQHHHQHAVLPDPNRL